MNLTAPGVTLSGGQGPIAGPVKRRLSAVKEYSQ